MFNRLFSSWYYPKHESSTINFILWSNRFFVPWRGEMLQLTEYKNLIENKSICWIIEFDWFLSLFLPTQVFKSVNYTGESKKINVFILKLVVYCNAEPKCWFWPFLALFPGGFDGPYFHVAQDVTCETPYIYRCCVYFWLVMTNNLIIWSRLGFSVPTLSMWMLVWCVNSNYIKLGTSYLDRLHPLFMESRSFFIHLNAWRLSLMEIAFQITVRRNVKHA